MVINTLKEKHKNTTINETNTNMYSNQWMEGVRFQWLLFLALSFRQHEITISFYFSLFDDAYIGNFLWSLGRGTMWLAQYKAERRGKGKFDLSTFFSCHSISDSVPICFSSTQDTHLMAKPLFTRRLTKELKGMWACFPMGKTESLPFSCRTGAELECYTMVHRDERWCSQLLQWWRSIPWLWEYCMGLWECNLSGAMESLLLRLIGFVWLVSP